MSVIQNGDTVRLTGVDAFKYEYNNHKGIKGLIKGFISFFLGRIVTLVEAQSLLKVSAPVDPPTARLSERKVSEPVPSDESQSVTVVTPKANSSFASLPPPVSLTSYSSSSEGPSIKEDSTKAAPEVTATPEDLTREDMATAEDMTADVEEPSCSPSELVDDFGHLNLRDCDKKLLRSVAAGLDVLNTQPEPLHEKILDALELGKDFLV